METQPLRDNWQESTKQEDFIYKWWSIHLAVLDQLWEKVVRWIGKSQENGKKEICVDLC
jgi:hypothetical protein